MMQPKNDVLGNSHLSSASHLVHRKVQECTLSRDTSTVQHIEKQTHMRSGIPEVGVSVTALPNVRQGELALPVRAILTLGITSSSSESVTLDSVLAIMTPLWAVVGQSAQKAGKPSSNLGKVGTMRSGKTVDDVTVCSEEPSNTKSAQKLEQIDS